MATEVAVSDPLLPDGARAWRSWARPGVEGTNPRSYAELPGGGPWVDEPDKVSWTDPGSGRPCLIVRGPSGALCGYAAVDPGHPWHGVDYETVGGHVTCHGGLTFAASCDDDAPEGVGICHLPEPGAPEHVFWFGFDAAHAGDIAPKHQLDGTPIGHDVCVYRDLHYMIGEVISLAAQLAASSATS